MRKADEFENPINTNSPVVRECDNT